MRDTFLAVARFLFGGICHQLPDRCLYYQGQALPICARCTGTFLGVLVALLALWAMCQGRRNQLPSWRLSAFLAVLVGLWGLDGANSLVQLAFGVPLLYEPRNSLRLATGMGFGLTIGIVLYPIYHFAMWRKVIERPVLEREWHIMVPLLTGAVWVVALLAWETAPFALWATVVSLAVFAVLAMVNGTLTALLLHKEGFADSWPEIVPYLLAGLLAALVEMGILGALRRLVMG